MSIHRLHSLLIQLNIWCVIKKKERNMGLISIKQSTWQKPILERNDNVYASIWSPRLEHSCVAVYITARVFASKSYFSYNILYLKLYLIVMVVLYWYDFVFVVLLSCTKVMICNCRPSLICIHCDGYNMVIDFSIWFS